MSIREDFRARVKGTVVPMPTPMKKDLNIDYQGVRTYTNFLIESGVQAISPLGTTGEFFTMTAEEHREVMKAVVEEAAGRSVEVGMDAPAPRFASSVSRYQKHAIIFMLVNTRFLS